MLVHNELWLIGHSILQHYIGLGLSLCVSNPVQT